MDVATLSTEMASMDLQTEVGIAVLNLGKETIDTSQAQLLDMMKQMEHSVTPHLGGKIDYFA